MERVKIMQGDITKLQVDAIVNAANNSLLGGGGVDGAIHAAAGPELLAYCRQLGGCETGEAKMSPGFQLPAKWIIHTVGPVWQGGQSNEAQLLEACYKNVLRMAADMQLKQVALPSISTGAYGFPLELASQIAFKAVSNFLKTDATIENIIFVCYNEAVYEAYIKLEKLYKGELFRETMEAKLKAGEHHTWMVKDYNRLNQNQE